MVVVVRCAGLKTNQPNDVRPNSPATRLDHTTTAGVRTQYGLVVMGGGGGGGER